MWFVISHACRSRALKLTCFGRSVSLWHTIICNELSLIAMQQNIDHCNAQDTVKTFKEGRSKFCICHSGWSVGVALSWVYIKCSRLATLPWNHCSEEPVSLPDYFNVHLFRLQTWSHEENIRLQRYCSSHNFWLQFYCGVETQWRTTE